ATLAVTGGIPVGLIPDEHDPSNRLPVLLKVATDETDAEDRIAEAYVHRQSGGNPVPLEDLAKVVRKSQPVAISRWNGRPVAYLTADVTDLRGDPVALEQKLARSLAEKFPEIEFEPIGDSAQSKETKQKIFRHLIPVSIGILLLLIWQTGSVRTTFSILLTVAPAFLGAAVALRITGQPFGVMALLGTVALAGIVVNNAIVLADRLRAENATSDSEILEIAGERLRPIFLSASCAILGLLPLLLSGNPLWKPFATAMIGGLVIATVSTLLTLPALWKLRSA
ncbi:MAG: efflux RND transporter permease subunit, partial [Verrucomicrobiales bacterium]|nr:efflux RND transporter permease subunit [Verrucomicrobiales bacterium]